MTALLLHHRIDGASVAPPLLLGPSLGTSLDLWSPQIPALSRAYRTIRWDLPGHGGSSPDLRPKTVGDLADHVLALADALGIDSFAYAGVSLGGAVGAWIAVHHPDRVTKLAMVCSSAKFNDGEPWLARAQLVRAQGTGPVADTAAGRWFTESFAASHAAEALAADLRATDAESYAACCEAVAAYDVTARLADINVPTLVIAGRDDPVSGPTHARLLADHIRTATLVEIPNASHLANVERPVPVTSALLTHFDQPATLYDAGMKVRREVLGDAHVDRAIANTTSFTADFQELITRYAWGEIWTRPGLDRGTRSCITLTALVAGGHHDELAMHVRAALNNGLTPEEIKEVLLQTSIYCGVPAANAAFAVAQRVLGEITADP
jgi:3-oxoadipate enol-lactonase / 4-carboxymuconolactone decarboxylase